MQMLLYRKMASQDGTPIAGLPGYVANEVKCSWLATHKLSQGEIPIHDHQAFGVPAPRNDLTITYFTRRVPRVQRLWLQPLRPPLMMGVGLIPST
jgi:hypothetical protein